MNAHAEQLRFFGHKIGGGGGSKGHEWKSHGVGTNLEAMLGCNAHWDDETDCVLNKEFYMDMVGLYEGSDTQAKNKILELNKSRDSYQYRLKAYREFKAEHPEIFAEYAPQHFIDVLEEEETAEMVVAIEKSIDNGLRKMPELALQDETESQSTIDTTDYNFRPLAGGR